MASLPIREAQVEMIAVNNMQGQWIEIGIGKTELAEIAGQKIEQLEE